MAPLELVIDDLACVREGMKATLSRKELAAAALEYLIVLMRKADVPHAEMYEQTYGTPWKRVRVRRKP